VGFRRRAAEDELDCLYDGNLSRTYSMQISRDNSLLAAAGHGGRVSLFGIHPQNAQEKPLLSWKGHQGWVAGVAFAGADAAADSQTSQRLLLTASNDKTVVLWDVNKAASGTPKAVTRTDRLHASGIFSLDLVGTHVLTAGKDARSVLSALRTDTGEISVVRSFEEHRSSVTKCARFRPNPSGGVPTVFADCGNDMCVCVLDVRSSTATPSIVIEGEASHGAVINSVAWHPTNEYILASVILTETVADMLILQVYPGIPKLTQSPSEQVSFEPTCETPPAITSDAILRAQPARLCFFDIHLLTFNSLEADSTLANWASLCTVRVAVLVHDVRKPDKALHHMSGHVAPNLKKTKAIYHPHFVDGGNSVLVTGQGLRKLSLYDVSSGATISRGTLGYDATALASDVSGELLAAAGGKSDGIALLAPIRDSVRAAQDSSSNSGPSNVTK
jgi:WD40 repeat protein